MVVTANAAGSNPWHNTAVMDIRLQLLLAEKYRFVVNHSQGFIQLFTKEEHDTSVISRTISEP